MRLYLLVTGVFLMVMACQTKAPPRPDFYVGDSYSANWVKPVFANGDTIQESSGGYWLSDYGRRVWASTSIIYDRSSVFNVIPAGVPLRMAIPAGGTVGFYSVQRFEGDLGALDIEPIPSFLEPGDIIYNIESIHPPVISLGIAFGSDNLEPTRQESFGDRQQFNYIEFDIYTNVVVPAGEYYVVLSGATELSRLLIVAR